MHIKKRYYFSEYETKFKLSGVGISALMLYLFFGKNPYYADACRHTEGETP